MEFLISLLVILSILLVSITLIGHGIWLALAWFFRQLSRTASSISITPAPSPQPPRPCVNCRSPIDIQMKYCGRCGAIRLTLAQEAQLRELDSTLRQLERLHQAGALDGVNLRVLKTKIDSEREQLLFPQGRPGTARQPSLFTPDFSAPRTSGAAPPIKPDVGLPKPAVRRETEKAGPSPFAIPASPQTTSVSGAAPQFGAWAKDSDEHIHPPPVLKPPRKPFAEVLVSFMEQSNIRWGEIVGGILIVGCSTALVISLWAQISRVPVLKFLIFTTVTAALFGVGFYTEHRWKLPTTSRGILTIATLLVPLNFLAIAAVSGNTTPSNVLVIGSELIAPAIFLCLVYFAGRVITSSWPHLLAAGVLASSTGQLLIRHFAAPDNSRGLLFALGAFPIVCYSVAIAWMLRRALADEEIDEGESNEIFITVGASTFAAALPFGLLLYRAGPVGMSMMHLAPLVTLGGTPMLACGALLWRKVKQKELAIARMVGTSIAIVGMVIVLAGMILAWPNPASLVPAALLNFAVFTAIAIYLDLPPAHIFAAGSLTLAYVVAAQVMSGRVPWQNLRVTSLLKVTNSVSTGRALIIPFVLFALTNQWLRTKERKRDAFSYLFAACGVAIVSLLLVTVHGVGFAGDPHRVSFILMLYAAGAFWFAWREKFVAFTWIAATLLFLAGVQTSVSLLSVRFPWQASLLLFAAAATAGALVARRYGKSEVERLFRWPLQRCAVVASVLATFFLLFEITSKGFEPASLLATRAFWLAAIWLGLLVLSRATIFFTAFQMTVVLGALLSTKSFLQRFEWYAYQSNAWLHPWALQIQGSVLGLICLGWMAIRIGARRTPERASDADSNISKVKRSSWLEPFKQSLIQPIAFDHLLAAGLVIGFALLAMFGALTGISKELTNAARTPTTFDLLGFPHTLIFGIGSWILLAILLVLMIGNFWERRRATFALGSLIIIWTICPLLAGRFEPQLATASAMRWSVAIFVLVVSVAFSRYRRRGRNGQHGLSGQSAAIRAVLLFITLVPLFLLTLSVVVDDINYVPARGPQAGIFIAMGAVALYGFPLIFAAAALAIHAVHERSPAFAFAAGLVVNGTVTVVHLVSISAHNGLMTRTVLANSLQLNAIAAASVALVWMATRNWWMHSSGSFGTFPPLPLGESRGKGLAMDPKTNSDSSHLSGPENLRREEFRSSPLSYAPLPSPLPKGEGVTARKERLLLWIQKLIAISLVALLIVPVGLHLIALPYRVGRATFAAGSFSGWLALFITIAVVIAFDKVFRKPISVATLSASLLAAGSLAAFGVARFGVGRWAGLHVLLGACILIAWLLLLARDLPKNRSLARMLSRVGLALAQDWQWDTDLSAAIVGALVVLIALRGPFTDPLGAWWSIGALLAMSVLAASLNWLTYKRAYLYAAGILLNASVSIWLIKYYGDRGSGRAFIEANVIALCLAGVVWLWFELRARRFAPRLNSSTAASFHNLAALLSLLAMGTVIALGLNEDLARAHQSFTPALDWLALGSLALLMAACLWDREAKYAVAGLYLIGLMNAGMLLHRLNLTPRHLIWSLTMAGAVHALGAALIWRAREPFIAGATRLKIPPRLDANVGELEWLSFLNSLLVAVVVLVAFWIDLRFFESTLRAMASVAVMAQTFTFGLMAQGKRRVKWQRAAISMLLLGAVFLGWSALTPGASGTWLNRAVILMTLMFATVALFGVELDKLIEHEPDWTKAFRDCVPAMTIAGIISLGFVLCTEVYYQIEFGAVRIKPLALMTVAITLAGAATVCVLFALSPKHDPLSLSEHRRHLYVYVAEALLALLFMHIRLTMPWLFTGFFERYWPLVVVGIAYVGVSISELLRRREVIVLAKPIERTGALLPLLPVLGFWIAASQIDYSLLLFVVGGLYGSLSILRRSFMFGLLAALAGNGGLWYLLHRTTDYQFWQHPQLWLIPMAISVLIAAHLNRKDFSDAQMTAIRYLTLVVIYVSSTADIFMNGVAHSPWLPLILAGLSVAGVFAGMIFRIRAFLLLGSIFLMLAIATMINYASVNFGWTWLWYVAGIVTGALIITTFAVFEKKRAEVLRVVDGLKDWQR